MGALKKHSPILSKQMERIIERMGNVMIKLTVLICSNDFDDGMDILYFSSCISLFGMPKESFTKESPFFNQSRHPVY